MAVPSGVVNIPFWHSKRKHMVSPNMLSFIHSQTAPILKASKNPNMFLSEGVSNWITRGLCPTWHFCQWHQKRKPKVFYPNVGFEVAPKLTFNMFLGCLRYMISKQQIPGPGVWFHRLKAPPSKKIRAPPARCGMAPIVQCSWDSAAAQLP